MRCVYVLDLQIIDKMFCVHEMPESIIMRVFIQSLLLNQQISSSTTAFSSVFCMNFV